MPANRMDAEGSTSTMARRASYCSERLRRKRGQCSAPGMMALSCDIIWQPLHTPRLKVSAREKNSANCSAIAALNRIDLAQPLPAPSTSP